MNLFVIPAATDAFTAALRAAASNIGLLATNILDGPSPTDAGTSGIAVGSSRENPSGEFSMPTADMASSGGQRFYLTCLAWSTSGEMDWTNNRNRCAQIVAWADDVLAADRTLDGSVSAAYIIDGVFDQEVGTNGIIVTIEFRIEARVF